MGKLRVLMVRSNPYDFDPHSYNVQEIGIGKALCDLGYDYDFLTFKKKDPKAWVFYECNDSKAQWIEVPRFRLLRWGINTSIYQQQFLSQYDLVICREYYQYCTYKICRNHPNVYIYNGPYWNMFMPKFFSIFYDLFCTKKIDKNVKCIFTKSELSTDFLKKKGYHKLKTIGVGLDTSRFSDFSEKDISTEKLEAFMQKNKCILYVGNIDKNKNYLFMLKVYEQLLSKHPDLKFVVIGKSKQTAINKVLWKKDSSFEESCYKKVTEKTWAGIYRINRLDNTQLKYIYPLAKAFILPSKKEIFGMVMLEAMYLGVPVVTSINGGSVTLIKDYVTGIKIKDYDTKKWVHAVDSLISDEKMRANIIKAAKKLVVEEYNWDRIVSKMLDYIGDLK